MEIPGAVQPVLLTFGRPWCSGRGELSSIFSAFTKDAAAKEPLGSVAMLLGQHKWARKAALRDTKKYKFLKLEVDLSSYGSPLNSQVNATI